jgi:uncharacterized alpha-E superfamily protein
MLSRVAENVYWMARYLERAENTARLINVTAHVLMDLPVRVRFGWDTLLTITGSEADFGPRYRTAGERNVVRFMTGDTLNPSSILSCLSRARDAARTLRDILPKEGWEQLNALHMDTRRGLNKPPPPRARFVQLNAVVLGCQQVVGILDGALSRDWSWDFLRAGRHLERADMTTRIIDVRAASHLPDTVGDLTPFENVLWMGVLKTMSGYQMYRRHTHGMVRRPDVLAFLLKDRVFPRSFHYCVARVEDALRDLPQNAVPLRNASVVRQFVTEVAPGELSPEELHQFIDDLQLGLATLHDRITAAYFRLEEPSGAPIEAPEEMPARG